MRLIYNKYPVYVKQLGVLFWIKFLHGWQTLGSVKINRSLWSIDPFTLISQQIFIHGTDKEIYRIILAPVFRFQRCPDRSYLFKIRVPDPDHSLCLHFFREGTGHHVNIIPPNLYVKNATYS
jgi:hypothetical protein